MVIVCAWMLDTKVMSIRMKLTWCFLWNIFGGFFRRGVTVGIELVINTEDGRGEQEELRNDGAVASGYFVGLADGQRDEREDDCGDERANGHYVFYCSGCFHNRNSWRPRLPPADLIVL